MPVRVPFSKSTVFKICRQKMCRFRVNGRPIRRIFHRFQNMPASCERSLKSKESCMGAIINDCAKDGGDELFTKMHCAL